MNKEDKKNTQFWCNDGVCFTCKMCGNCCGGETGFIWLCSAEKQEIANYLDITEKEFEEKYLCYVHGRWSIKELPPKQNFDCIFLKSGSCSIYPVRPAQCKKFPFWESMLCDKNEWDFYASRCPGMNSGRHYTIEEIQKLIKEQKEQKQK